MKPEHERVQDIAAAVLRICLVWCMMHEGDLEDGVGVTSLPGRGAAQGGALQIIAPMQAHICWKHIAHHHKPRLRSSMHFSFHHSACAYACDDTILNLLNLITVVVGSPMVTTKMSITTTVMITLIHCYCDKANDVGVQCVPDAHV